MLLRLKREIGSYKVGTRKSYWVRSTTVCRLSTEIQNISFISTSISMLIGVIGTASSTSPQKYPHFSFFCVCANSFIPAATAALGPSWAHQVWHVMCTLGSLEEKITEQIPVILYHGLVPFSYRPCQLIQQQSSDLGGRWNHRYHPSIFHLRKSLHTYKFN